MKNFLLVLIVIFMNLNANAKPVSYKILSRAELNKIEEEKWNLIDTGYIIDYNAVFVTIFKDGTAMLRPPVMGGDEGLLFYDIKEMNEMIASKVYPVKGTGSFWEKEIKRIVTLPSSIPYYCDQLSKILKFNVEVKDDPEYLKQLSALISSKIKTKKSIKNLNEYLSIYIGELLRQRVKGEWKLAIEYAFHIYYTPDVTKGENRFDLWFIMNELELAKYTSFDIEYVLKKANERFHPYNPDRYDIK